jgi:hypothetical protein
MIEQQLHEIASHINKLQRQERMFIEELRVLMDMAGPDLSQRLAAVNARMDASNSRHVRPLTGTIGTYKGGRCSVSPQNGTLG